MYHNMSKIKYIVVRQEIASLSAQLIRATIGAGIQWQQTLFSGVYPDLHLWQQIK